MFHVLYDVPQYCCAALEMLLPQIEQDHFDWEASGRALSYKDPREIEKVLRMQTIFFFFLFKFFS